MAVGKGGVIHIVGVVRINISGTEVGWGGGRVGEGGRGEP